MSGRALLSALLGAALVFLLTRLGTRFPDASLELADPPSTRLDPRLAARLDDLDAPLFVTYWVSPREQLPSSMRHMEAKLTRLLERCRRRAPELFDYQVVHPDGDERAMRIASRRGVAPVRLDHVLEDAPAQAMVWSSLSLEQGDQPATTLHALLPHHLPRVQALLWTSLDQRRDPVRARIAVDAPDAFAGLRLLLSEHAELLELDLAREPLPEADLLLLLEPERLGPGRRRELDRFLDRGGSILIAPPPPATTFLEEGRAARIGPAASATDELLADWGVQLDPSWLLDERCESLRTPAGDEFPVPFLVRSIAPNQDFRSLDDARSGNLLFLSPRALRVDESITRPRGWIAEVVAASSDLGRRSPWPESRVELAELASRGRTAPKQPLMLHLHSADRWRGSLLVLANSTPLRDPWLDHEETVHRVWLGDLMRHLLRPERLVRTRTAADPTPLLVEITHEQRRRLRLLVVASFPALILLLAALRAGRRRAGLRRWRPRWRVGWIAVAAALLIAPALLDRAPPAVDLRDGRALGPAAATQRRLDALAAKGTMQWTWTHSPTDELPAAMRRPLAELRRLLLGLERAGRVELSERIVSAPERPTNEDEGPPIFEHSSRGDERAVVHRYHNSLRLELPGAPARTLGFRDGEAIEGAEFRVALALEALERGRPVRLAFASDSPRPSPAEGYEHYQVKGRIPPKGNDVYSRARRHLQELGFEVLHVNPRDPQLPDRFDALVWMQPRRDVEPMLERTVQALHDGARVLIAAQHFVLQAHQYRGRGYDVVYWPEPQSPDVDRLYFPWIGIHLVREVLFDRNHHAEDLVSRVHGRGAAREFEAQSSALPFHVRVDAEGLLDPRFGRNLGPQSFSGAAFLRWEDDSLRRLGLRATPLIQSSPRSWSYAWTGGYLPPECFEPSSEQPQHPRVLAALFEGRFPLADRPLRLPRADDPPLVPLEPAGPGPEGALVLVAGSSAFQDGRLQREGLRADQLLLNLVAGLCLPEDLRELATQRSQSPGLRWLPAGERTAWRARVLGLPLGVMLLLAAAWRATRRRRP